MTCAVCGLRLCLHNDLEYAGLRPTISFGRRPHAGVNGAGTSITPPGIASPKPLSSSFHATPYSRKGQRNLGGR